MSVIFKTNLQTYFNRLATREPTIIYHFLLIITLHFTFDKRKIIKILKNPKLL